MSNRTLDRYLENEQYRDQCACVECGYLRSGGHHPKIKCPKTGRCGDCGNDWPCAEHAPPQKSVAPKKRGHLRRFDEMSARERLDACLLEHGRLLRLLILRKAKNQDVVSMRACLIQYGTACADIREADVRKKILKKET